MTTDLFDASQAFGRAVAAYNAGKISDAEKICQQIIAKDKASSDVFHLLGVVQSARNQFDSALENFERALALDSNNAKILTNRGIALQELGRFQEALLSHDRALVLLPNDAEVLNNRGVALQQLKRYDEALDNFDRAIQFQPNYINAHFNRAVLLQAIRRLDEALASYDRALRLFPNDPQANCNRGVILHELERLDEALASYDRALAAWPNFPEALSNRGTTLRELRRFDESLASFNRALSLRPNYAHAYCNRGNTLQDMKLHLEALSDYDRALVLQPDYFEALYNRGVVLMELKRYEDAVLSYDRALAIRPDFVEALKRRGETLCELNRSQEAVAGYERTLAIQPEYTEAKFGLCTAELPILYADEEEIIRCRAAFERRLRLLHGEVMQQSSQSALFRNAFSSQLYYLPYQNRNDRDLQRLYGEMVCRLMAARYSPAALSAPPKPNEPVRIGFVSGFFHWHSIWKIPMKGWMEQLDRSRFRIFGYHTSGSQDDITVAAEKNCDKFVQGAFSLDQWRDAILADSPHVLIYPEIGMDPIAAQLAMQRLAPIQCQGMGHPETTGYPTLDYVLSSDLMEPDDGQLHYTEKLIRLPNMGVYYEPLDMPPISIARTDIGLRSTATIYWCPQSLFKYLPQHDQIFPRIAREVPDSQFIFIESPNGIREINELFWTRLKKAFSVFDLRAEDHCVVLPRQDRRKFGAIAAQCDIALDSIGWSGNNSTLENLDHDMPIVTMPGQMMRGRHTMAILKMMGVTETVVGSMDDYVSTAVSLAHNQTRRAELRSKIAANKHRLYRDRSCILALDDFIENAARGLRGSPLPEAAG
jgi:protein O-GlcNAc transferase